MRCPRRLLASILTAVGFGLALTPAFGAQLIVVPDHQFVRREPIEWIDLWLPNVNKKGLPQVLLIGDSITEAYYRDVAAELKDKAYVGYFASSLSIGDPMLPQEIALVLENYRFDVIHFNNGLHGKSYSEKEFALGFPQYLEALQANGHGARLVWASSTPVRTGKGFAALDSWTARVKARNNIASAYVRRAGIPIDDLYPVVLNHPEYYTGGDGIHPNAKGKAVLARHVAESILALLRK